MSNNKIHPVPVKRHIDEKLKEKAEGAHRFEFERFHTPGAGIIRDIIFGFKGFERNIAERRLESNP